MAGMQMDGSGLSFNVVSMQIGGELSQEASTQGTVDDDRDLAIKILAWALPEIALTGGGTVGSAKCLPALLYVAYASIFLLLLLLDVVLLSMLIAMAGRFRALIKFGKVAAVTMVTGVPLLVLLCKVGLSLYPKCMHPTSG